MKFFLIGIVTLVGCFSAQADDDMIEYRQEVMSAIGGTMGAMGKILKQEVSRQADLVPLSAALNELAMTAQGVFPEGSQGGDALPEIWQETEDFNARLTTFLNATNVFREATQSGDMAQIGAAVREVGQSCRGCHQTYRK